MFAEFFEEFSGDLTLLLLMAGVGVALGMIFGRFRLVNILINIYIAFAAVVVLPESISDMFKYSEVLLFFGAIVVLTLLGDYLFDIHMSGSGPGFFWRLIVMSFLEMGLVVSLVTYFVSRADVLEYISKNMYFYFASDYARVFWFAVPILFVFYLNKKSRN